MVYMHFLHCVLLHLYFTVQGADVGDKNRFLITTHDEKTPYGPLSLTIFGPDAVTVGVPCSYVCLALCSPGCSYTIGIDDQHKDGFELAFTLNRWVSSKVVTCTGRNNVTGTSSTITKTLNILEGPVNVSISGLQTLTQGETQRFLCTATCRPSCNYTWVIDGDVIAGYGDELEIRPDLEDTSGNLICKATNTVSGLFVTAVQKINVRGRDNKSMSERAEPMPAVMFAYLMSVFLILSS